MCDICRQYKCPSTCPHAPAPPVFAKCVDCGDEIFVGDDYYDIDGDYYCTDCMYERRKTAEVEYV